MVVIQVLLCVLDSLHLKVALGQACMCLHFFEFQRVLAVFLLTHFLRLLYHLLLNSLLKFLQVLFLVVNALLELSLHVVKLSNFVGDSGLALVLACTLTNVQPTVISLK